MDAPTNKEERLARKAAKAAKKAEHQETEGRNGHDTESAQQESGAEPRLTNKEERLARKAAKAERKEAKAQKRKEREPEEEGAQNGAPDGAHDAEAHMTNKEKRLARKAAKQAESDAPAHLEEPAEANEGPVLSHKDQRKRRKMEKRPREAVPERRAPARSEFAVWIGNLSFRTTSDDLRAWLEENGVVGISRINMPAGPRRDEHNKGFAYVDLPSADAITHATSLSESFLGGRRLLIKDGSDFRGRPGLDTTAVTGDNKSGLTKSAQKILHAQKNPAGPTLFMGNLSFETTEDEIRLLFEGAAEWRQSQARDAGEETPATGAGIRRIRMGTFEDTGKCKGCVYADQIRIRRL